jgi:microcystin-dependent protein
MSDPYIGEIRIFAGTFAPAGWAQCAGQVMAISQNTALFSILGTTYGGNGTTTFQLPDLRGRFPMHVGTSSAGIPYTLGEVLGSENVALNVNQLPIHSHAAKASPIGTVVSPQNAVWSTDPGGNTAAYDNHNTDVMSGAAIGPSGSDIPHQNMQPYLGIMFIIALFGIYPSRN